MPTGIFVCYRKGKITPEYIILNDVMIAIYAEFPVIIKVSRIHYRYYVRRGLVMKNTLDAEATVLVRIMDMLEEGSVTYLAEQDDRFADFIGQLYTTVNQQSRILLQKAT